MSRTPLFIAALISCFLMTTVNADVKDGQSFNAVQAKIRALVPNAKTIAISETPIEGILQVQINSDIVYVTADGQYLLQGQIMDIDTQANITDQAKSGIRLGLLSDIKQDEQIIFSPKKPDYDLIVFTSPSTFNNFCQFFGSENIPKVKMASIGETTSKAIRQGGAEPLITAKDSNAEGLYKAIIDYYQTK